MYELATGSGLVAPSASGIRPFRLCRPQTIAEALRAHRDAGPDAVYVQGSTDVMSQLRNGRAATTVISLRGVADLGVVARDANDLVLGAAIDHHDAASSPVVAGALPGLAKAWGDVANVRIRRRASLGGNLMARRPRYELSGIVDALGATVQVATPDGEVPMTPADLWALPPADAALVVSVRVPIADAWFGYDRTFRPMMMLAVALRPGEDGLRGRAVVSSECRAPAGVDFAVDLRRTDAAGLMDIATEAAARLPDWIDDATASAAYRRRLAATQLQRQLRRAMEERSWIRT